MPQRPGDFGIEEVNGMVWLVRALEADETKRKRKEAAEEFNLLPDAGLRCCIMRGATTHRDEARQLKQIQA